jgi:photosystem II stability/assembly factor-like uncharacterized protein
MSRNRARWWPLAVLAAVGAQTTFVLAGPQTVDSAQASASWVNVTGSLANQPAECGNLTLLSPVPGSGTVIAGVAGKGLWANSTGTTWTHMGDGAGSASIINRPSWVTYDPTHPGVFWESGIYGNGTGGVFRTNDGGTTFQALGSISHNDYVSVDFSDPNRQLLLAGGHEQSQRVYRSTDGGQNWTNIGLTLPANSNFSSIPLIISSQTYVVNLAGWAGGVSGIFRTVDAGASWQQVSTMAPGGPPLVTSTGAIYWPFYSSLLKSTNGGSSWTQVGTNLQTVRPIEMPDGSLVSIGSSTLMTSTNGGVNWTAIGPALPFPATPNGGVVYSPVRQAFFIWHLDCGGVVLPDAIWKLDWSTATGVPGPPSNLRVLP